MVFSEFLCFLSLVSDFFYPNTGGVENHIYNLGECLMKRGHRVVVVTHSYVGRRGVCYFRNGLKVYYLPLIVVYNGCILPTVYGTLMLTRHIIAKEKIDLVHGHSVNMLYRLK
ncbi:unnamed protein product [Soboliphyme baturini]|uniref:PIGA domain-containing protein n=1 Tax=Soboliphyme baturini TaxID=241478 RepID=A0A183JB54_9BILA|nr:unnamed protein product [Soboliphyme baturini]